MKQDIEIRKTGAFFDIDDDGYLINPTSHEKIQDKWKSAIEFSINAYKKEFGDNLKNVYLRGSVPKGVAIEDISDLDTFAYLFLEKDQISRKWRDDFRIDFQNKYPFINGIDIMTEPASEEKEGSIFLNQSLCVFGEESKFDKLKVGKDLILHAPNLQIRFGKFYAFKENLIEDEIPEECSFQMKGILRVGLEILIEKTGKYSRDLYPCYELFSEYYPEKEQEMRNVLHLVLNPTNDMDEIERVITGIGSWLVNEVGNVLNIKQN